MAMLEPIFYPEFRCTADACPITCCQEWRIWVDEKTRTRWENYQLDGKALPDYTLADPGGGRIIELKKNRLCPFLTENRLCRLVVDHGDEILSDTCTVFPRQNHQFPDRMENALMAGCPAVVDLLKLHQPFPEGLTRDAVLPSIKEVLKADGSLSLKALRYIRRGILKLLMIADTDTGKTERLEKALMVAFYLLLEVEECSDLAAESSAGSASKKLQKLLAFFHSSSDHARLGHMIDDMDFDREATLQENMELFLDLSSNYLNEGRYQAFLEPLCHLAEELLEDTSQFSCLWEEFSLSWEPFRPLFLHYLEQEVFAALVPPDGDLQTLLLHFQWMIMSAMAIRQAIFLRWVENHSLTYEKVRECFCIISRMTGYDDEDIEDYLDSMFEDMIWEWGYLALLVGY